MQTPTTPARNAALPDPFFPTALFAKVPAEALTPTKFSKDSAMTHAEFRVFVALCRFRGPDRTVHPTRLTLEKMTLMTPNNISRATAGLQKKGWLVIHYLNGRKSRVVANYELGLPGTLVKPIGDGNGPSKREKGQEGAVAPVKAGKPRSEPADGLAGYYAGQESHLMTDEELDALLEAERPEEFQYALDLEVGI